jgi:hypothetical protein
MKDRIEHAVNTGTPRDVATNANILQRAQVDGSLSLSEASEKISKYWNDYRAKGAVLTLIMPGEASAVERGARVAAGEIGIPGTPIDLETSYDLVDYTNGQMVVTQEQKSGAARIGFIIGGGLDERGRYRQNR